MASERQSIQSPSDRFRTAAGGQAARWISLGLDLHTPCTWFGPTWAVIGGVVSAGRLPFEPRTVLILVAVWLLGEPLLGALVALSARIASARAGLGAQTPTPDGWSLPYFQPGSPGQRLLDRLAGRVARLRLNWRAMARDGERWSVLALLALVLGVIAGDRVVLLVALALVGSLCIALYPPARDDGWALYGGGQFLLAWLLGHAAFATVDYASLLVGIGFAIIWCAWMRQPPLARVLAITSLLLASLLLVLQAPLAAAGILLLVAPLFVLWPESPVGQPSFVRHTQIYLMAALLLAAWGVAWHSWR